MTRLQRLEAATLRLWLDAGDVLVVDVRETAEYMRGHIAGALSMPLSRLDASTLPRDKRIVLYCTAGNRSQTAARRLGCAGCCNLAHLEGGLQAWLAAGLPVLQAHAQHTSELPLPAPA
jgi:rhodanese-related sulfurtransferase